MRENSFVHRIEKEEVNELPLAEFAGEVVVVNKQHQVPAAVDYLSRQTVVGVDTETRPSFTRGVHYPTALLQIATEDRCYLFQLNKIGLPQELADIFANPDICKVGLAFRDDLRGLQRRQMFEPQNCVDIQSLVLQYGILDLGLQKIFAIVYGRKISKSQQLTNWDNVFLTAEQARYASTDAWATLLIYKRLMRTKPLKKKEWEALHTADLQRQLEHQQQVIAERSAQKETK